MIQVLLAAPSSGSGKTTVTCALIRALQNRGICSAAFKCGPDYIDPMFHRAVLGAESRNLDLFLSDAETVRSAYAEGCTGKDAAVIEGVMGYYDGLGGVTADASPWHVADTLGISSLLVIRPKGSSLTLAPQITGLQNFRSPGRIGALLLNGCSPSLAKSLAPMLERETGIPVLGCLPHIPDASIESRHLGLYTASEIEGLDSKIDILAESLEKYTDIDRLMTLFDCPAPKGFSGSDARPTVCRIALAHDEAFCFTYPETVAALRNAGAEIVPFSPLSNKKLPDDIGGLYLPGGYPELYAERLSSNLSILSDIHDSVTNGLPTVAECGGYLYLCGSLEGADSVSYPMAGVLPGYGVNTDRLVRFGYAYMTAEEDSLLFRKGETVPVHEFHYWDSTENGTAFCLVKPLSGRSWREGFASPTLYAAFPHLYLAGNPIMASRFVEAAREAMR
jgi:cobyrinic acid a,c-diamide synthase